MCVCKTNFGCFLIALFYNTYCSEKAFFIEVLIFLNIPSFYFLGHLNLCPSDNTSYINVSAILYKMPLYNEIFLLQ